MAKRIAQIILPKADNEGHTLAWQHEQYRKSFCILFGGYTAYDVSGGWYDQTRAILYQDESVAYHIAIEDDLTTNPNGDVVKFLELASAAKQELRQEAIMIVLPSGDVEFV